MNNKSVIMKKTFLFLLVILTLNVFSTISYPQCYTVLSVKGEIISEKTGQPIKEMDEICAADKLKFTSKDSKAAVLSPDRGRYIVKFAGKKTESGLVAFLSSALFAGKERLSTKIMEFDEEKERMDFYKNEFGNSYCIINKSRVYADTVFFRLSDKKYFAFSYFYEGKDFESRLKFENNCFEFGKELFEGINTDKIELINLYYIDGDNSSSIKLASFRLAFLEESVLKSDLANYISILKKSGKEDYYIVEQAQYLVNDIYGNINYYDLAVYMESNFGIKGY